MIATIPFNFGTLTIYDNYIISVMNEGITVTTQVNDEILKSIEVYFRDKPFFYIANRIYSYAVDPSVYKHISQIKNLKGIAVVSSNRIALNNAKLEKLFIDKPFESFYTLEDAVDWVNKKVDESKI